MISQSHAALKLPHVPLVKGFVKKMMTVRKSYFVEKPIVLEKHLILGTTVALTVATVTPPLINPVSIECFINFCNW